MADAEGPTAKVWHYNRIRCANTPASPTTCLACSYPTKPVVACKLYFSTASGGGRSGVVCGLLPQLSTVHRHFALTTGSDAGRSGHTYSLLRTYSCAVKPAGRTSPSSRYFCLTCTLPSRLDPLHRHFVLARRRFVLVRRHFGFARSLSRTHSVPSTICLAHSLASQLLPVRGPLGFVRTLPLRHFASPMICPVYSLTLQLFLVRRHFGLATVSGAQVLWPRSQFELATVPGAQVLWPRLQSVSLTLCLVRGLSVS